MKRILTAAFAVVLFIGAAQAQTKEEKGRHHKGERKEWKEKGANGKGFGKRGGDMGRQAAFFKKQLNLTASQESKLESLFQEFRSKAQDIRSSNSLNQEQKRAQVQTLAQQYMAQGKALLTPEQVKKFEELKNQRSYKKNRNL